MKTKSIREKNNTRSAFISENVVAARVSHFRFSHSLSILFSIRFNDTKGSAKRSVIESSLRSTTAENFKIDISNLFANEQRNDTALARKATVPLLFRSRLVTPSYYLFYREAYWRVQMVHPLLPAV